MVPDKPQKVENFHFTWCGYIGFSARCYVNRNEYTEYRFLNHCMALLNGFNWSILQKMQVWLRGDVLWCFFWFPFEYGSCQLWQDALYFYGRQLLFTSNCRNWLLKAISTKLSISHTPVYCFSLDHFMGKWPKELSF